MRKKRILPLLVLLLLLGGCTKTDAHPDWGADWVRAGDHLGVEPMAGFNPGEANDALSLAGIWYFTWTSGAARTVTNDAGEDAEAYDAVIYLLVSECADAEAEEETVADWLSVEAEHYETDEARTLSAAGQDYTLLPLLQGRAENPYSHGAAAFTARGDCAVSVELLCAEGYDGDPQALIEQFITGFHYGD